MTATTQATCIYFIRAGKRGPIKIGITTTGPFDRAQALQCGNHCRLIILATMPCIGEVTELIIHRKFRRERFLGEWFRPSPRLMLFIKSRCTTWDGPQPCHYPRSPKIRRKTSRLRGRPKTGNAMLDTLIFRIHPAVISALDAYQKKHGLLDRSEAVRKILADGLAREGML